MTEFHNKRHLKERRQGLRNNATPAEAALWNALKNKQLDGRKFRRQHSFGNHIIADLYCPSERLVIELDGQHHFTPAGMYKDQLRDEFLKQNHIRVLRIENRDVFEDLENVLARIRKAFR